MEAAARKGTYRWAVHLGLIARGTLAGLGAPLDLHIVLGLVFVVLVGAHLVQRRRITGTLARRVVRVHALYRRGGRLAVADAVFGVVTAAMFVSGSWDWSLGHPTRTRWHALTVR